MLEHEPTRRRAAIGIELGRGDDGRIDEHRMARPVAVTLFAGDVASEWRWRRVVSEMACEIFH